jgi:hypothetical protein
MSHKDFYPNRARIEAGEQPLDTEFHDVLLIPQPDNNGARVVDEEQFFRFPVVKVPKGAEQKGHYVDPPELWDRKDTGQRKVIGIAHSEHVQNNGAAVYGSERGPAFALMPVRAEPGASSCAMCYLVDARNLLSPNTWTAEEWNAPRSPDLPPAPGTNATEAETLLGLPRGIVLRLKATGLQHLDNVERPAVANIVSDGVTYELEPVTLKREPEIWNQLRNGTIAGRALYRALKGAGANKEPRILPLVNVTCLQGANP